MTIAGANLVDSCKAVSQSGSLSDSLSGAIVGAATVVIVAFLTLFIKDFLLPRWNEKKKAKREKIDAFKKYANPLVLSAISLAFRLKEVFEDRGYFLLKRMPRRSDFNDYKFKSTVFRLCSLIGWIRASKKELTYLEVNQKGHYEKVEKAINEFEKILADGNCVEVSRVRYLCQIFEINCSLQEYELRCLSVNVDQIIDKHLSLCDCQLANLLEPAKQEALLIEIIDEICDKTGHQKIAQVAIKNRIAEAIKEISRIETWIYRDWQNAIGDMMITEITGASRRFDVIGYGAFEDSYFDSEGNCNNKWICRMIEMFNYLDVKTEDRFDARVSQLKGIYHSIIELIQAFSSIDKQSKATIVNPVKILSEFDEKLVCQEN